MYCDDNNDLYPARQGQFPGDIITGRFLDVAEKGDDKYRLSTMLGAYIDPSSPTWTCGLYTPNNHTFTGTIKINGSNKSISCSIGGEYGCSTHGIAHLKQNSMSYKFYGGVEAFKFTNIGYRHGSYPLKSRHKFGDRFIVTDKKANKYYSTVMWSDFFDLFDDAGRNKRSGHPRFYNYRSLHQPPPNSNWAYWWEATSSPVPLEQKGVLSIFGPAVSNWSFEDGSVKSIKLQMGGHYLREPIEEYFYILEDVNRQYLIPIEPIEQN